ncbi:piggyBac transposable element-derived protein 3-like [Melanotaenia boesemani]|uniref:piggyBac transposable element-derived protein 3-like n=1 Tax=Melanotaenia boesemani TaxID=1250792 RepID=UPI001C056ABD|nr:piggyBac transposable element-derived protein 3-like [Melanotaenia boesemani]
MQRRFTTTQALQIILGDASLLDSDADEIDIEEESEPEQFSEADSEDDAPHPLKKNPRLDTTVTETAKDGTVWRKEEVGRHLHFTPIEPYAADGEPTPEARTRITTRLQSFLCFLSLQMLRTIQACTIQHARDTETVDWFMAVPELMAFIAIIIWRGVKKVPSLSDNWSKMYGNKEIMATMARDRFQKIMQHLRFDCKDTRHERVQTDRFAAISELWESFRKNCVKFYRPGRHITIDEQLYPSKTRCPFLQYIATKPDKFGIKFRVACDLKSKYICNVYPYVGKDPSRPKEERLSESVVMKLIEPFLDQGRTVTTDNFFTSISLSKKLLSRKTTIIGTVNKIRREIPPSAKVKNCSEFSTQVFTTTNATLTVYAASRKKTVYVMSSMHGLIQTEDTHKKKPTTITQYNKTKCGVDSMDQMVREYSVRAGTRRWPVAVFYNMVDMAALNAYVLYQACTGRKERRPDFLMQLASELAASHVTAKQIERDNGLRKQAAEPEEPAKRKKCQVRNQCRKNLAAKRCVECSKFTCGMCKKEEPWRCKVCAD